MPCCQKTRIEILDRDLKFSGAILVDHPHVIRTDFLDRPAHTIHPIVVGGNDKGAKLAMGDLTVLGPGGNRQGLAGIFKVADCRPACRLGIETLIHSGIQFQAKGPAGRRHDLP